MTNRLRLETWILRGLCLSLLQAGAATADTKAFVGARIFDGTGKPAVGTPPRK